MVHFTFLVELQLTAPPSPCSRPLWWSSNSLQSSRGPFESRQLDHDQSLILLHARITSCSVTSPMVFACIPTSVLATVLLDFFFLNTSYKLIQKVFSNRKEWPSFLSRASGDCFAMEHTASVLGIFLVSQWVADSSLFRGT